MSNVTVHILIPKSLAAQANETFDIFPGLDKDTVSLPCSSNGLEPATYMGGGSNTMTDAQAEQLIVIIKTFVGGLFYKCDFDSLEGRLTLLETNVIQAQSEIGKEWNITQTLSFANLKKAYPDDL